MSDKQPPQGPDYGSAPPQPTPPPASQPPPVQPPPGQVPPGTPPQQPTPGATPSSPLDGGMGQWISGGWQLVTSNLGMAILLIIIMAIPSIVAGGVNNIVNQAAVREMIGSMGPRLDLRALWTVYMRMMPVSFLIGTVLCMINPLLWIGGFACFWEGTRTGRLTLEQIGLGLQMPGPAIVLGLILAGLALAVNVTSLVCIGVFVSFPAMSFGALAHYDLAVRRQTGGSAASTAWTLLCADFWGLSLMGLACFGIYLLGALACGVGVLVSAPVVIASYAFCYRDMTAQASASPATPA